MSRIEAINNGWRNTRNKSKFIGLIGVSLISIGVIGYFTPIPSIFQAFSFVIGSYLSAYMVQEVLSNAIAYKMLMGATE